MKIPKPPIDAMFLKSSLGILKIFQMGWSLIAFILSDVRRQHEWGRIAVLQEWAAYEAMSGFLFFSTLLLWVVFLASWHEVGPLSCVNWLGLDVFHSALGCLLSLINLILAFSIATQTWLNTAIPIFCVILAALCCFKFSLSSRHSYRKWHSLRPTPVIPYQDYQYSRLDQAEEEL
ncbi:hypothetical protein Bbelb_030770 [Branchiostoma belcheri]|nr:hypothetical protein Bbelb_030770 [Branchiostoma belcheri]